MLGFGLELKAQRRKAGLSLIEDLGDAGVGARANDSVDLGNQRAQLVAVTLRQTACHDEPLAGPLGRGVFEDRLRRFGFGRIDEGTGIDHDCIGAGRLVDDAPAGEPGARDHHLGVYQVLRAAQADEGNALRRRFLQRTHR